MKVTLVAVEPSARIDEHHCVALLTGRAEAVARSGLGAMSSLSVDGYRRAQCDHDYDNAQPEDSGHPDSEYAE